ncbi:MAG: PH domain-containing protein [Solirubrobacterales bacterium]
MAPKLQPGERVIYEGHPSWRSILDFYLKGLLLTAVICAIVAFITGLGDGGPEEGIVTLLAIVGVSLTILIGFVKRVATSYTITDRRLHIKKGIVSRTIQETRLERVQNVNFQQGIFQRILQIGDVDFDTAAGDDYQFQFSGVAEPADVVHKVDEATHASDGGGLNPPSRQQAPQADPSTAPTQQQPPPPQG